MTALTTIRLTISHTIEMVNCGKRYRIVSTKPDGVMVRMVSGSGDPHPFLMGNKQINDGIGFGSIRICDHDFNPLPGVTVAAK